MRTDGPCLPMVARLGVCSGDLAELAPSLNNCQLTLWIFCRSWVFLTSLNGSLFWFILDAPPEINL